MWTITLSDLRYRYRQFGIAVAGAALVFAMTLILTGITAGFATEARDIVRSIGTDAWVVPRGALGPFTSQASMPESLVRRVARTPGVVGAHPLVKFGYVARLPSGKVVSIEVIGHDIGRLGDPLWNGRRSPARPGETVVDERLGAHAGDVIRIEARRFRVARVVSHRTFFAGTPAVYLGLDDARALAFSGRPLASTILVRGQLRRLPGFAVLTNAKVRRDLVFPLEGARTVLANLRLIMWAVAALIIGAVTYLSALERIRDFAVLKAVGSSSRILGASLAVQAVIASLLAALLAAGIAQLLAPAFPVPVTIDAGAYLALPGIAIAVGVIASLTALRRAVRVDPALAFAS